MEERVYYYLDRTNNPQGPHTAEELRRMVLVGLLSRDTLCCKKGDAAWLPIHHIISDLPPTSAASSAPDTQQETNLFGLPRETYRDDMSMFAIFKHVILDKYADFRGRATRREYWLFHLASMLIHFCLQLLMPLTFGISGLVSNLLGLFTFIPSTALCFRRLHDIGRSGWWYLGFLGILVSASGFLLTVLFYAMLAAGNISEPAISSASTPTHTTQINEQQLEAFMQILQGPWLVSMGIALLLIIASTILILVFLVKDSQKGTNQYGPSYKYPDEA